MGGKCDVAKVLDFGLVKLTATPDAPQLTADYTVSGTPQYMSPEQATAIRRSTAGRIIYSLGAILYFMLTGRPPFEGNSPTELMIAHARDPVVPPSKYRSDLPADLEAVVMRCLAKKPDDRYPDARALARRWPTVPVLANGTTSTPSSGGSTRRPVHRPICERRRAGWKPSRRP